MARADVAHEIDGESTRHSPLWSVILACAALGLFVATIGWQDAAAKALERTALLPHCSKVPPQNDALFFEYLGLLGGSLVSMIAGVAARFYARSPRARRVSTWACVFAAAALGLLAWGHDYEVSLALGTGICW